MKTDSVHTCVNGSSPMPAPMKDVRPYLLHIQDAISRIGGYTSGGRQGFLGDNLVQDAVLRNLMVIGEAAKHIPAAMRRKYREVPWKQVSGMRDVLIHEYFGVRLDLVWETVQRDLPKLDATVATILEDLTRSARRRARRARRA
jgi:uncharacterized protein with HEPN domain